MSLHQITKLSTFHRSDVVIETIQGQWVIPCDCELVKMLVEQQKITASDLCFSSKYQSHCFAKRLFLLALEDECRTLEPSKLAVLAREIVNLNSRIEPSGQQNCKQGLLLANNHSIEEDRAV